MVDISEYGREQQSRALKSLLHIYSTIITGRPYNILKGHKYIKWTWYNKCGTSYVKILIENINHTSKKGMPGNAFLITRSNSIDIIFRILWLLFYYLYVTCYTYQSKAVLCKIYEEYHVMCFVLMLNQNHYLMTLPFITFHLLISCFSDYDIRRIYVYVVNSTHFAPKTSWLKNALFVRNSVTLICRV